MSRTVSLSEKITNTSGATVTISQASVTGGGFSASGLSVPATIGPGANVTFTITFAPTSTGAASGTLIVASDASNSPLNVPLSGTGVTVGAITANPTSLAFDNVQAGTTSSKSQTVTNTGAASITISQANITGAGFSVSGLNLPTTLTSNQSLTFTLTFAPTSAGSASGTLAVVSDASNSPLNVGLSGTGTAPGQLSVAPAALNFGDGVVGTSKALTGSLTAASASVAVTSATINSNEYTLSGISLPQTISAGQSVPFTVTFTPAAVGTANASLTFASNATNAPTIETLTGNGTAPPPHSVDLSWNASPSANVVGYNVYRELPGGSFSKINSTLDSALAYTDNQVLGGQTYLFAVTAVDGTGVESALSTPAQVTIPSP